MEHCVVRLHKSHVVDMSIVIASNHYVIAHRNHTHLRKKVESNFEGPNPLLIEKKKTQLKYNLLFKFIFLFVCVQIIFFIF